MLVWYSWGGDYQEETRSWNWPLYICYEQPGLGTMQMSSKKHM